MAEQATSPEVIVVGGIAGTSIAWRLAESGRRVLLLSGAASALGSGRNAGMTGAAPPCTSPPRRARGLRHHHGQPEPDATHHELGRSFSLLLPGTLDIITTEAQYEHLKEAVAIEQEAGIEIELLDTIATRSIMPVPSPAILGAAYAEDRGHFWPFALVTAIADAVRHGAELRVGARVQRLLRDGDRADRRGSRWPANPGRARGAGDERLDPGAAAGTPGRRTGARPRPDHGHPAPGRRSSPAPSARISTRSTQANADRPDPDGGFRRDDENEGLGTYLKRSDARRRRPGGQPGRPLPELKGKARVVRSWAGIMGFTADGLLLRVSARAAAGAAGGGRLQRRGFRARSTARS